ncbi:hypothetical protein CC80DRAFT_493066 [Byssothecium circinans]|uniref:Uncharacterized protein n=1 Tax=Byssothecium circinans TaxID=147558 RepID=A0A6A5TSI3_9PLEO|nr:hypothetical protein CC80DRAFT_493066 [Byssothecium circinans]
MTIPQTPITSHHDFPQSNYHPIKKLLPNFHALRYPINRKPHHHQPHHVHHHTPTHPTYTYTPIPSFPLTNHPVRLCQSNCYPNLAGPVTPFPSPSLSLPLHPPSRRLQGTSIAPVDTKIHATTPEQDREEWLSTAHRDRLSAHSYRETCC